jgi:rubrerythrin
MKMSTMDNLKEAFAGESQANRKYLAFAKKADAEGHTQIAKSFRAAADAETVHAHAHLRVMGGIKSTEENLKEAIEGETEEFEEMYPGFIEEAKAEDNTAAVITFENANAVEKIHAELYKKALENMANNEEVDYYVCQVCGNTVENEAPEKCPICGVPASKFIKID